VRLSALIQVYNEELCIGPCLAGLLPVVDELVIVHGGPDGVSDDNTMEFIKTAMFEYPEKMVYLEGMYRQEDNQWDHTRQNNLGLELVTGDFLIRTHADLIYDIDDVAKIREAIEKFPDMKYFYAPMIDFYADTDHILLPAFIKPEELLARPHCGDPVAISMKANPIYVNYEYGDGWTKSGMQMSLDWIHDVVYLPHINRYHYAFVKPFKLQVAKMYRNLMRGQYETLGEELKQSGERYIYQWIIDQVLQYEHHPARRVYAGDYPSVDDPIHYMTSQDGYDEFIEEFQTTYFRELAGVE